MFREGRQVSAGSARAERSVRLFCLLLHRHRP